MRNTSKSCCKDCTERHLACWDTCKKYAEFVERNYKAKEYLKSFADSEYRQYANDSRLKQYKRRKNVKSGTVRY